MDGSPPPPFFLPWLSGCLTAWYRPLGCNPSGDPGSGLALWSTLVTSVNLVIGRCRWLEVHRRSVCSRLVLSWLSFAAGTPALGGGATAEENRLEQKVRMCVRANQTLLCQTCGHIFGGLRGHLWKIKKKYNRLFCSTKHWKQIKMA